MPIRKWRKRTTQQDVSHTAHRLQTTLNTAQENVVVELRKTLDLYANILIPKAQQSVTVTQTAYSAEEAGFLDLIDTERVLLNFQNSYYRAVSNYGQALALIEAKVGQSVVSGDAGQMEVRGEEAGGSGE